MQIKDSEIATGSNLILITWWTDVLSRKIDFLVIYFILNIKNPFHLIKKNSNYLTLIPEILLLSIFQMKTYKNIMLRNIGINSSLHSFIHWILVNEFDVKSLLGSEFLVSSLWICISTRITCDSCIGNQIPIHYNTIRI